MAEETRVYTHEHEGSGVSAVAIVAIVLVVLIGLAMVVLYWDNIFGPGTAPPIVERTNTIIREEPSQTNTIVRENTRESTTTNTIIQPESSESTPSGSTPTQTQTTG